MNAFSCSAGIGLIGSRFDRPDFIEQLDKVLVQGQGEVLASGRHQVRKVCIGEELFAIKDFGKESLLKHASDRFRGSKAKRSYLAAKHLYDHGIGTPEPVAFLEQHQGVRITKQVYISRFAEGLVSFKDILIKRLSQAPTDCTQLMELLWHTAKGIRDMHDAGMEHRDLGNQNIFIQQHSGSYAVSFIDLNRARFKLRPLRACTRGKDLSRIYLPSDLRRIFHEMYWDPATVPQKFKRAEKQWRFQFHIHTQSRPLRHPIRALRNPPQKEYPSEKNIFIWDQKTEQPIPALRSKDRNKYRSWKSHLAIAKAMIRASGPAKRKYTTYCKTAFSTPGCMSQRMGFAMSFSSAHFENEKRLLQEISPVPLPILMRLYHHDSPQQRAATINAVTLLLQDGHQVALALVQDRNAIEYPERWQAFVDCAMDKVGDHVAFVEIGHAINRVKWGLWKIQEYRSLCEPLIKWQQKLPGLRCIVPAIIDFDLPHLTGALDQLPEELSVHALSSHLYVDRRGAPEQKQGAYDATGKMNMIRAMATNHSAIPDRLIITETNWPLSGQQEWSPIGSPYVSQAHQENLENVGETTYASYMIRYLLMALCSGSAEQVYWWKLISRGFGLIDDSEENNLRKRPAYNALKTWLQLVGQATFTERKIEKNRHRYFFSCSKKHIEVTYCPNGEGSLEATSSETILDLLGTPCPTPLVLEKDPVYVIRPI